MDTLFGEAWVAWQKLALRLPHAVLIHSGRGFGAHEFSREVAAGLLCEQPLAQGQACGRCPACGWFDQGNHPDYRLLLPESLAPDAAQEPDERPKKEKRSEQIKVEQIRALADFLAIGTHRRGKRVILAYPADAMNPNAQNALLKSLEEPPPDTVFLLATTQPDRMLATVRSRCRSFALPLPDGQDLLKWLKGRRLDNPETVLARVGGAPFDALVEAPLQDDYGRLLDALSNPDFDPESVADMCQKGPVVRLVDCLQRLGLDLLQWKVTRRPRYHPGFAGIGVLSERCTAEGLAEFLRYLAQARSLSGHPLNARLFAEDLLLSYRRLIVRSRA